jgi:hypothetical protein
MDASCKHNTIPCKYSHTDARADLGSSNLPNTAQILLGAHFHGVFSLLKTSVSIPGLCLAGHVSGIITGGASSD